MFHLFVADYESVGRSNTGIRINALLGNRKNGKELLKSRKRRDHCQAHDEPSSLVGVGWHKFIKSWLSPVHALDSPSQFHTNGKRCPGVVGRFLNHKLDQELKAQPLVVMLPTGAHDRPALLRSSSGAGTLAAYSNSHKGCGILLNQKDLRFRSIVYHERCCFNV